MLKALLLLCVLVFIPVQELSANHAKIGDKQLKFELSANKASYIVGEPIDLTFTLINNTNQPINGHFTMSFQLNNLEVRYIKNQQGITRFVSKLVRSEMLSN